MDAKIFLKTDMSEMRPYLNKLNDSNSINYLDDYEKTLLFKHSQITTYKPNEVILEQGKKMNGIYMILEGEVLVSAQILGQGDQNLEVLPPGYFFSAICFIEKGPCPTSFIAKNTVLCLFIPNSYFEMLTLLYPETSYKILYVTIQQIYNRLKESHDMVTKIITHSNMSSLSFFDRIDFSIREPKKMNLDQYGICVNSLKKLPLFSKFAVEDLNDLFEFFSLIETPKNYKLLQENDSSPACFLILKGAIQSGIIADKKLAKLAVFGPNNFVATVGCIDKKSSFNFTLITSEHSILLRLSESVLSVIKNTKPELWYNLFELIAYSITQLKKSIDKLNIRLHTEIYNR